MSSTWPAAKWWLIQWTNQFISIFCSEIFILRYLRSLNKIKEDVVINRYQSVYSFKSRLRHCDLFSVIGKCASERKQICQSSLLKPINGKRMQRGKSSVIFVFNIPRDYPRCPWTTSFPGSLILPLQGRWDERPWEQCWSLEGFLSLLAGLGTRKSWL